MKSIDTETKITKKISLFQEEVEVEKILKDLSIEFGFPEVQQILTIYFKNNIRLRCDANNLFVGKIVVTKNESAWKEFNLSSQYLGSVINVLTNAGMNKGSISIVQQMSFPPRNGVQVNYLSNTLISKHQFETAITGKRFFHNKIVNKIIRNAIDSENIVEIISKVPEETIIDSLGTPNEKIIDYCKQANLSWTLTSKTSFYHRISAISNDYTNISLPFTIITGNKITDTVPTPQIYSRSLPSASVVIPVLNGGESLIKTLLSLDRQNPKNIDFEVIIVDDGSTIPFKEILDKSKVKLEHEPIIVRQEKNSGSAQSRNVGAAIAKNEIIVFLDSDIIPTPNYLYEHLLRHKLIRKAVLVSFKENIDPNDQRITVSAIKKGVSLPKYQNDLRLIKYQDKTSMGYYKDNYLAEGDVFSILSETNYFKNLGFGRRVGVFDLPSMVVGNNFSIPNQYFHNIGGFDNSLGGYGLEDSYIGIRAIASGAFVLPVLSCGVYHLDHPTRRGNIDDLRKEFEINSKKITEFLSKTE